MYRSLLSMMLWVAALTGAMAQGAPQLKGSSNRQVIDAMTLEEKVRLLVGMGMRIPGMPPAQQPNGQGPVVGVTQDRVPGAAGTTAEFQRLGVPGLVVADGPAGLRISPTRPNESRTYYATAFPIASLLASSWDTELLYQTGAAMGSEVKAYGVDVILGPGMNIHRNALGGRNFEYYSEDPLLTGKMAAAMVNGIQSNGVGTSIKHFAANNHETNRNTINVRIGQRALREIYLRGFEIAVKESNPWTVMSSYNKINGTYTSESPDLLLRVLRDDWGYKGFVMTDWFGGMDPVAQVKAGNDLIMPGTPKQYDAILAAAQSGELSLAAIDANVNRILDIIRLSPSFAGQAPGNNPNHEAAAAIARRAAAEGMVLLKNEAAALPLTAGRQPAVFGIYAYDLISGGTGSGDVNEAYTISLTAGLQAAGLAPLASLQTAYEGYIKDEKAKHPKNRPFFMPPPVIPEMALTAAQVNEAARTSSVAIITLGRISGEFADRKTENDYYLSEAEKTMLRQVSEAFRAQGKKVIVVLNVGGVIETASWRDQADAILLAWLPGQEAGHAIADIISGRVNPSGKLPTTFAVRYEDDPTATGFPGREYGEEINLGFFKARPAEIDYTEGIYMGYRAFDKNGVEPAWPFGYGLSYTRFTYGAPAVSASRFKGSVTVSVTVTNSGNVAGREVAQLYLSAPRQQLDKPEQELKGFAKTRLLAPGESQTLSFTLDARALASFDEASSAWVAEKGQYEARVGASSRDIRGRVGFQLRKNLVVAKVSRALAME